MDGQEVYKLKDFKLWMFLGASTKADAMRDLRKLGFDTEKKEFYSKREILSRVEEQEEEQSNTTVVEFKSSSKYQI